MLALAVLLAAAGPITGPDGLAYRHVPAGTLEIGCVPQDHDCQIDEIPRHEVHLTRDVALGATEVTIRAYRAFAAATGRRLPRPPSFDPEWGQGDHPMVNVTWHEAAAYCEWVGGRLPTEAEWERAARAATEGAVYFGPADVRAASARPPANAADRTARRRYPRWETAAPDYDDGFADTAPVGRLAPNAWGFHDLAGNALEWCTDRYDRRYYAESPADDPAGPRAGGERVLRGGSWQDPYLLLRLSDRFHYPPHFRASYVGFRCARPLVDPRPRR